MLVYQRVTDIPIMMIYGEVHRLCGRKSIKWVTNKNNSTARIHLVRCSFSVSHVLGMIPHLIQTIEQCEINPIIP